MARPSPRAAPVTTAAPRVAEVTDPLWPAVARERHPAGRRSLSRDGAERGCGRLSHFVDSAIAVRVEATPGVRLSRTISCSSSAIVPPGPEQERLHAGHEVAGLDLGLLRQRGQHVVGVAAGVLRRCRSAR